MCGLERIPHPNNGDHMWDKLISKYENIVLVLSGHDPCDRIVTTQTKGVGGNTVTQMLIDPQGLDDEVRGGTGMVAMLYFSEDGSQVQVEYISTVKNAYFLEENQFSVTLDTVKASAETPTDTETPTEEPTEPETEPATEEITEEITEEVTEEIPEETTESVAEETAETATQPETSPAEETEAATSPETDGEATTASAEATTAPATETPTQPTATETDAPASGCGAVIGLSLISTLAMAAAVVLKKKNDCI